MGDDAPEDPLPKLIADIDQLLMVAPQIARSARGFYDAFKSEGFSDKEAAYLTASQLVNNPLGPAS